MGHWMQRARELNRQYATHDNIAEDAWADRHTAAEPAVEQTAPQQIASEPHTPVQTAVVPVRSTHNAALPPFLTPTRQRVLDTIRSLQAENDGQFVSFDDIERAIGTRLTHDQIAAGLTALVVAEYVTRDEMSHGRLDPRYGIGPVPDTSASPASSPASSAEPPADFEGKVAWRLALLRDRIPATGPVPPVVVCETPDTKLPGHCSMCGAPLPPERVSSPWRRCAPCIEALRWALE